MKHLIEIATGALWGFDATQDDIYDAKIASGDFRVATDDEVIAIQNPPLSADQVRANYEAAAQKMLDDFAKTWGYDSLARAATYATSKVPRYKAECDALVDWRDDVWTASEAIDAAVRAGGPPPASEADYLADLPAPPARPVVS